MQQLYSTQRAIIPKQHSSQRRIFLLGTQLLRLNEKSHHWSNLPQFQTLPWFSCRLCIERPPPLGWFTTRVAPYNSGRNLETFYTFFTMTRLYSEDVFLLLMTLTGKSSHLWFSFHSSGKVVEEVFSSPKAVLSTYQLKHWWKL